MLTEFTRLDADSNSRNVAAWRPVICDVYRAYSAFPREEFLSYLDIFYVQAVEVLGMDNVDGDLRRCLELFFKRIGEEVVFSRANGKQKI